MAKLCCVCDKKLGMMASKTSVQDGVACSDCIALGGIVVFDNANSFTAARLKEYVTRRAPLIRSFNPTKVVEKHLKIDENNNTFFVDTGGIFEIADLLSFELLEDGESVLKGGVGGAILGGALFGGAGAIVGGLTGRTSKKVCNSMQIRITVKNSHTDTMFINCLGLGESGIKTNNILYRTAQERAQKYLSALQIMDDMKKSASAQAPGPVDAAAELQKFHDLMKSGVISEEEFNAKKAQLLGL